MLIEPIGLIESPFKQLSEMPIQPSGALGVRGTIRLNPEYTPGLADLDGFSHMILLYLFHRAGDTKLAVTPFLDQHPRGIFSTRAPTRPNPIGLSIVKLCRMNGHVLEIENVDILNGTPLLDIKPYVPDFDQPVDPVCVGWLETKSRDSNHARSDQRFTDAPPSVDDAEPTH